MTNDEMTGKQYTERQIRSAIRFWTKKLSLMNESYNAVVDALVDEFGHDLVFSRRSTYQLTDDDLHKIFSILNLHFFQNKLSNVKIAYWPESKVIDTLNEYAVRSEVFDQQLDAAPCYGVHTAVCKDIKDQSGNVIDVKLFDDIIMMNSDYLQECIFIFAVASICHEMIHAYDRLTKQYHDNALESSRTSKRFDAHDDDAFQKKMKEANSLGIHVIKEPMKGCSYTDVNLNARFKLYSVFGEDESDSTIVCKSNDRLVMRTKGSDKFFICDFD